jgi:hypothetical protein
MHEESVFDLRMFTFRAVSEKVNFVLIILIYDHKTRDRLII